MKRELLSRMRGSSSSAGQAFLHCLAQNLSGLERLGRLVLFFIMRQLAVLVL